MKLRAKLSGYWQRLVTCTLPPHCLFCRLPLRDEADGYGFCIQGHSSVLYLCTLHAALVHKVVEQHRLGRI